MTRTAGDLDPKILMQSVGRDELMAFARDGYLHLRGIIPQSSCDYLIERTWSKLPDHWVKNDPQSWCGDVQDSCHLADLNYRRGLVKFQKGELVEDQVIHKSFGAGSPLEQIALGLIGRPLRQLRVRGLYPNIPAPERMRLRQFTTPHVEAHPAHLVALCYLSSVGPSGGGLLVWPGSHHSLYNAFSSKLEFDKTAKYDRELTYWAKRKPIELCGSSGDVILIHHRLFHAPSLNRSDAIRFAFLCDYLSEDYKTLCTEQPKQIWEDWEPIRSVATECSALRHDQLPRWTASDTHSDVALHATHFTTINKREGTEIARARRKGDIWLSLSNSVERANSTSLDPSGTKLDDGTKIKINGRRPASMSTNGITARARLRNGTNSIEISGTGGPCLFRLINIRLPFSESILVHEEVIELGTDGFALQVDYRIESELLYCQKGPAPAQKYGSARGWLRRALERIRI